MENCKPWLKNLKSKINSQSDKLAENNKLIACFGDVSN